MNLYFLAFASVGLLWIGDFKGPLLLFEICFEEVRVWKLSVVSRRLGARLTFA